MGTPLTAAQIADRDAMGTDRMERAATPASNVMVSDAGGYFSAADSLSVEDVLQWFWDNRNAT